MQLFRIQLFVIVLIKILWYYIVYKTFKMLIITTLYKYIYTELEKYILKQKILKILWVFSWVYINKK